MSSKCVICPRKCNIDRDNNFGYCKCDNTIKISKTMIHKWEEPCISGDAEKGSGAIFFAGCPLHCLYCQNNKISSCFNGKIYTINELSDLFLEMQEIGAYNINLVSPTQYTLHIIKALDICKSKLNIPVVWNTGGYELPETIKLLNGYVDIFLTDFKYGDNSTSSKYSNAKNYVENAYTSLLEMINITGKPKYKDQLLLSGTIVRHLILPGEKLDSIKVIDILKEDKIRKNIILSLMSQYTPEFYDGEYSNLKRKLTTYEYEYVLNYANLFNFDGYSQEKSSATSLFTPEF